VIQEENGSDQGLKEDTTINSIELKRKPITKKPTRLDKPRAFEDKRDDDPAYRSVNRYAILDTVKEEADPTAEEIPSF
jgi:hypothetical protein